MFYKTDADSIKYRIIACVVFSPTKFSPLAANNKNRGYPSTAKWCCLYPLGGSNAYRAFQSITTFGKESDKPDHFTSFSTFK